MSRHRVFLRAVRYATYAVAALAALLVGAALLLPRFLDTPAVERELKAKLSQLVQGEVAWEKLSIRILPSPRGSLTGFTAKIPGTASLRARQVDALLRLLPLLHGRAEVASVSLSRPEVRLEIAPSAPAGSTTAQEVPMDPVEGYRSAVDAIHRFAPDAELDVEDGLLDVVLPGMPPVRVRQLELHGQTGSRGVTLELTAASDAWSRLEVRASVDFSDLSGAARVDISGLKAQDWLDYFLDKSAVRVEVPEASVRVDARSDGKTRIQADFDVRAATVEVLRASERARFPDVAVAGGVAADREEVALRLTGAQLGSSKLGEGSLHYGLKSASLSAVAEFDLDLAQAMDATRRLLPEEAAKSLAPIQLVSGRAQGQAKFEMRRSIWNALVDIRQSDASVGIEDLPGPVKLSAARVSANGEEIAVRLAGAQLGASRLGEGSLRYGLKDGSLASAADFDLDLAQAMDATRRLLSEDARKALAPFQPVSGRAQGQAKFEMRRSVWNTHVDIRKSDASVGIEGLPGPVRLASARVDVTGDAVRIERADVAMLDARALASATIAYGKNLRIEGAVSEASVGENLLAWVWKIADLPPHLVLKTPVAVAVQRAAWSRKQPLALAATASFDAGPSVTVDLAWTPQILDIRSAAVKDARSDAVIALHLEKSLLLARFSGTLQNASIAATLKKGAKLPSGSWAGDLRIRADLEHPERFSATGKLAGESVDLAWLLERPVIVERADVQADGQKLRVRQATVNWAGQRIELKGDVSRAADGAPIIDAQIDSPGVVVDALLKRTDAPPPAATEKRQKADGEEPLWTMWPLPVRGRIVVHSGFIQYGERRAEPVVATLTLAEERAFLELQQVRLCGVSFPLTVEGKREGLAIAVRLSAQKQQLERTAHCLTEQGVQIDGEFDLSADLRTQGRVQELIPNLQGSVSAQAREGKVRKFAMLGNILSTQAVAGLFKQGGPKLDEKGFPYRSITATGRFDKGAFVIDEAFFRSDIIGLAAKGSISLIDDKNRPYETRLTVLVAPLGRLDQLVRSVPVLGYLLGGTLTSVPVAVSGDIRDPRVVPLGPGAVISELGGVFERALKLPGRMLPNSSPPAAP
jgi:AsmA-like C-terminal region